MKPNPIMPIHLATHTVKENCRPIMEYILFEDDFAIATNAHILTKISLQNLGINDWQYLNGQAIHRYKFTQIVKVSKDLKQSARAVSDGIFVGDLFFKFAESRYNVDGFCEIKVDKFFIEEEKKEIWTRFPNYRAVIPTLESPRPSMQAIGLNIKLLERIAKIYGTDALHIEVSDRENRPHVIYKIGEKEEQIEIGELILLSPLKI